MEFDLIFNEFTWIYSVYGPRATTRPATHYKRTARDRLLWPADLELIFKKDWTEPIENSFFFFFVFVEADGGAIKMATSQVVSFRK